MTETQEKLAALDEAGRLLAPILKAETDDLLGWSPYVLLDPRGFRVFGRVNKEPGGPSVSGVGETLSAAFTQFLANRSDKLSELAREAEERAAFEAFRAQRQREVA
jgi:hypothetical protein